MDGEARRWATLSAATDAAYRTFSRYRLAGPILSEMSGRVVVRDGVPLRGRTAAELDRYAWKAITTWGTVNDYKHFLPRLLELSSEQHRRRTVLRDATPCDELIGPAVDLDMIAMKLQYAEAHTWPAEELDALEAFGLARWWWELDLLPNFWGGPRNVIALLAAVGRPLHEALGPPPGPTGDDELLALARFVNESVRSSVERGGVFFDWAADGSADAASLERWFLNPAVEAAMEAAFFRTTDPAAAEELSDATRHLGWLRTTWREAP